MDNIRKRLYTMPMVAVAIMHIAGIVFAARYDVPSVLWLAATAIAVAVAILAVKTERAGAGAAMCAAMFSIGALRMNLEAMPQPPCGELRTMTLRFDEPSVVRGVSSLASARMIGCEGFDPEDFPVRLVVWGDSSMRFSRGDEITFHGVIRPFGIGNREFADMAFRRGYAGSVLVRRDAVGNFRPVESSSLHDRAVARLCSLLPDDEARRTILSMATGERIAADSELRRTYARGGAAHLLAVSGLHVGIVFLLVNALLRLVPIVRGGNILRSIAAIAAIWLYVALCEYPPSAVRAAAMFTVLQLSFCSTREYSGVNALAFTASMMAMITPGLVFDIGFRMSFVAVAAILLWGVPLYRRLRTRHRVSNAVMSAFIIGAVSTVAVMPLVSNAFGLVSIIGIPLNPLVLLSANAIVFTSVASLVMPLPTAAFMLIPAYGFAWLQNETVALAASVPWGCFDYRMPDCAAAVVYAVFAAATVAGWGFGSGKGNWEDR